MGKPIRKYLAEFGGKIVGHGGKLLRREEKAGDALTGVVDSTRRLAHDLAKRKKPEERKEAIARVKRGIAAYNKKDYERAESNFKQAIDLDPEYARAHLYMGNTFYRTSRISEALRSWHRAIQAEPHSPAAADARNKIDRAGPIDGGKIRDMYEGMKRREK